jgi:hypothetical protein
MSPSRAILEELAERNADEAERADRERREDYVRTAVACIAWGAVGAYCLAWSFHTSDLTLGRIAFFSGLGLGNAGVIFTLLAAYRRGERRGDW